MDNNIQHLPSGSGGTFYYVHDGEHAGEVHYQMTDQNKMIIDHTGVDGEMEGNGIGTRLLEALVGYAREKEIKVVPQCSFARVSFERQKEWKDVLDK